MPKAVALRPEESVALAVKVMVFAGVAAKMVRLAPMPTLLVVVDARSVAVLAVVLNSNGAGAPVLSVPSAR